MKNKHITFIGAGNMAHSLIGGLIDNQYDPQYMTAIDPNPDALSRLAESFGIHTAEANPAAAGAALQNSDCIMLAVKPQVMSEVIAQYKDTLALDRTVFISIAAGISSRSLEKWLSAETAIVRCMPNTPSLVKMGASVLYANQHVNDAQKTLTENILSAVGIASWVDNEDDLHAVTATSGSGPAYFFLLMEQMQKAAENLGLEPAQARQLVTQTALGAASMAANSTTELGTLRENVTSKGGTTAAALDTFAAANFNEIVEQALQAAASRSREMATLFDK